MNSRRLFIYHLLMHFIPATRGFAIKAKLLRWCGAEIGHNVRIVSSAKFFIGGHLSIGDNTWIGHEVLIIGGKQSISIGENCDIAPRVSIISGTHYVNSIHDCKIAGEGYSLPIYIENGCWLCVNSTVLGGSAIARNVIVAAGAIIKGNVEKNTLISGHYPFNQIKKLLK